MPVRGPCTRGSIQRVYLPHEAANDTPDVLLAKKALRSRIRAARAGMSTAEREAEAARLSQDRLGVDGLVVAGYLATPTEPDIGGLLARAAEVLLPVPLAAGLLGWAIADGNQRRHDRLPVLVPAGPMIGLGARALLDRKVAVLIVPALAVGRDGWRLGQGGGYYDRILADLDTRQVNHSGDRDSSGPLVVAVVYESELLDHGVVPHGAHDRPVSHALTPAGLVKLG